MIHELQDFPSLIANNRVGELGLISEEHLGICLSV
jgi:hypothetical protein